MNIDQSFPSKYLKAADLQGRNIAVKISGVQMEDVGSDDKPERKPVVYFQGAKKGLVLNKTNALTISEVIGSETDNWVGVKVQLFATRVPFQGRMVDAIRLTVPRDAPATAAKPAGAATPTPPIVHPAGLPATDPFTSGGGGESPPPFGDDGLNDDVPFSSPWGVR